MFKAPLTAALLITLSLLAACDKSAEKANEKTEAVSEATSKLSSKVASAIDKAKQEITAKNMTLGTNHGQAKAEITPQGDFLIDSKAVAITPEQRQLLIAHRQLLINVAIAGMEIGMQGVDLAGKAAGDAIKSIFTGDTDTLEKKVETEAKKIEESAEGLCKQLPLLMESQQKLAASLPEFKPYATMTADDIDDCHGKVIERK